MPALPLDRRPSQTARWSRRIGFFAAVLLGVSIAARFLLLVEPYVFVALAGISAALGLAALLLAAIGFTRLWRNGDRAGRNALAGTFWALLALTPALYAGAMVATQPFVNEAATDAAPPDPEDGEAPAGLTGRRYAVPLETVLESAQAEIAARGWTMELLPPAVDAVEMELNGVAETLLLRFPSDVTIRLSEEDDGSTLVDMRVASRFGSHDLGYNAALIRRFLADLDRRIAGPVEE